MVMREAVGVDTGISPEVCRAAWDELTPAGAHALARLRVDVLVVESGSPHAELDDLDLERRTEHLWIPDGDTVVAYLRVVRDVAGTPVIDRACARPDVRRLGLVTALVTDVIARHGAGEVRADARPGTVTFFARLGFELCSPAASFAGAATMPMRRHPEAPWRE
jgi:ElaA protein